MKFNCENKRTCKDCGQIKELSLFPLGHIYKGRQYYQYVCKECSKKRVKAYRAKNLNHLRERAKLYQREYRKDEVVKSAEKRYYKKWYCKGKSIKQLWRKNNREKCRLYSRKYYSKEKNDERVKKLVKEKVKRYETKIRNDYERYSLRLIKYRLISKDLVENLDDKYLRHLISQKWNISPHNIPSDIIELYKSNILLKRTLKKGVQNGTYTNY